VVGTVLGSGMTMLDGTVVNIALPRLGRELGADFADLQWVVNGYTLALASLILLGGSLGDRLGRRRVFTVGVVWFTVASLLCAAAPSVGFLVAARLLQGVGGALLVPGSLAMLQASFHPDDRARAIGAWSGLGGVTAAAGPFLGGWLVDAASWRWIFLLNVPLGAVVLYVVAAHLPETRDPTTEGRLDLAGAVLGAGGLAAITYGFIERSSLVGGTGAVVFVAFLAAESRQAHPMLSLSIFRSRQFSAANAVTFVLYGGLGMALFLVGLVLQEALGYAPLEAGTATLPITFVMLAFSARAGGLARRIGPRIPMSLGPAVMAGGLVLMVRIGPGSTYVGTVLPALLVFSAGLALTVAPLTATALAAADTRHAGLASGVNNAVARTGQLLAVALIPILAGFGAGEPVAADALVDGFHRVVLFAATAVALGGALSWAFIRSDVLEAPATEQGAASSSASDAADATPVGRGARNTRTGVAIPVEPGAAVGRGRPTYHCGTTAPPLCPDETPRATVSD